MSEDLLDLAYESPHEMAKEIIARGRRIAALEEADREHRDLIKRMMERNAELVRTETRHLREIRELDGMFVDARQTVLSLQAEIAERDTRLTGVVSGAQASAMMRVAQERIAELEGEGLRLRALLWLHHGHVADLYGDDGELQCRRCPLDFKREAVDRIEWRFLERAALAEPERG